MADNVQKIQFDADPIALPIGRTAAKISGGIVLDDQLPQLQADMGRKIYRQMAEDNSICGAILFSVEMLFRASKWSAEPADKNSPEAVFEAGFLKSNMLDMAHSWDDFISEVVSFLWYGWSYHEMVYKRREDHNSMFPDGRIGVHSVPIRAQDSLLRWELAPDNTTLLGMTQMPWNSDVGTVTIPMGRSMLFRAHANKGSPEGRSILRRAYRPWYMLRNIEDIEAIGIERELNGLPVIYVPSQLLKSADSGDEAAMAAVETYLKIVRDVKMNEQGGVMLPSDPYKDAENRPTTIRQFELQLLSTNGQRLIDTNVTIRRYQMEIARSVLADFIMLGAGEKGSFALSKNKTDLYITAVTGWQEAIAEELNRRLVPTLWALNGLPRETMPKLVPGKIAPENLEELSNFIEGLSRAGFPLFPNDELERQLMDKADLPMSEQTEEL